MSPVCDHIEPHRGHEDLFFNANNLQTLHKSCHDRTKKLIEAGNELQQIDVDGWPVGRGG